MSLDERQEELDERVDEFIKSLGNTLRFRIEGASYSFEQRVTDEVPRRMSLRLALEGDVLLPDKTSLKEVSWSLDLVENPTSTILESDGTTAKRIGQLSHYEARRSTGYEDDEVEACGLEVVLRPDKFSFLLECMRSGRPPTTLFVKVHGMEYGGQPDGSVTKWDKAEVEDPDISQISFRGPFFGRQEGDSEDDSVDDLDYENRIAHIPASCADIESLQKVVSKSFDALTKTIWNVFWAAVIVAALLSWLARNG